MKDYLNDAVRAADSPELGRLVAREYLQGRVLLALQRSGAMVPLAFHGGTALRFLYGIPRFSADLDFTLERPERGYDLPRWLRSARTSLQKEGYTVDVSLADRKVVHSALVRLPGVLYELGLSPHANEVLAVKVEIDTSPPAGAGLATTIVRRHVTLHLQHHDKSTLLSGKLHAILQRPFAKGRDIFDLVWYLSDTSWPPPNLPHLNAALAQTGWSGDRLDEHNWRAVTRERLTDLSWHRMLADVEPLLEPTVDPALLQRDSVLELLG